MPPGRRTNIAKRADLDELDIRILEAVQANAAVTRQQLADQVSSTAPTVHRRLVGLRRKGLISRIVALADTARSNEPLTVVIGLALNSQMKSAKADIKAALAGHRAVKMAWMTTGEYDYIIVCGFAHTPALMHFTETLLGGCSRISTYRIFVSLDEIKFDTQRSFRAAPA